MNHRTTRAGTPPVSWPLDPRINVVLFAGLGGACQGLEAAGCPVHLAVNHDAVAIAAHRALNPHTRHIRGDIFDVDPVAATGGRQVKILWASPDCRDHSVAKGGAPRSPRVRSMPWQICRWAAKTRPPHRRRPGAMTQANHHRYRQHVPAGPRVSAGLRGEGSVMTDEVGL